MEDYEDYGYYYLGEMVKAIFGMKSVGVNDRANNILADKKHIFDREEYFDEKHEVKFKEVFEVAFTEGAEFIYNHRDQNHERQEIIDQMQLARNFNTFILQMHGIDIIKTYSFKRNTDFVFSLISTIKKQIFYLIHEVLELNNICNIRSEIGFRIFSNILNEISDSEGIAKIFGDYIELKKYIIRYDFKRNLLIIYGKINIDWSNEEVVNTVYDAMLQLNHITIDKNTVAAVPPEKIGKIDLPKLINIIKKRIKFYNELKEQKESKETIEPAKILIKIFYLCSLIEPFKYNGRNFLCYEESLRKKTRESFLKNIFVSIFNVSGISLRKNKEIYELNQHERFLLENSDAFKCCKFGSKSINKIVGIFDFAFSKDEIIIYKIRNKNINDYSKSKKFCNNHLVKNLAEFFETLGFKNISESIMLNALKIIIIPELFNVTELTDDFDKIYINTAHLFKNIADFLINECKTNPFLSDEYYFRYKYYSIYRYVKDDVLFYKAIKEMEEECNVTRKNNLNVSDYEDIRKSALIKYNNIDSMNKIYKKLYMNICKWDVISNAMFHIKKVFFEKYNYGNSNLSLILLKIILLCENFAPSDEYVEVKNYGLPDDRLIEAAHKYADELKKDNEKISPEI